MIQKRDISEENIFNIISRMFEKKCGSAGIEIDDSCENLHAHWGGGAPLKLRLMSGIYHLAERKFTEPYY